MKLDYVLLRKNNPSLSIFDEDCIINKELLNSLVKCNLGIVLDYGAGNSPWEDFLVYKEYKRADIQQNLKKKYRLYNKKKSSPSCFR